MLVLFRLQVAEDYINEDGFYFPHNLDFRGRAYPMHPNLNHLGADLSRGLLQFADPKPLGSDGLRWLEISVSSPCCRSSQAVRPLFWEQPDLLLSMLHLLKHRKEGAASRRGCIL